MPFQKGQSGNPAGRPPKPVEEAKHRIICEVFDDDAERLATMAIVARAAEGDVPAYSALMDRKYGKARQAVELSGPDGGPIDVQHLTDDERVARAAELFERARARRAGLAADGESGELP